LGSENLHMTEEYICDSSKVNKFCTLSRSKLQSLFFFVENTYTVYLRILHYFLLHQIREDYSEGYKV